MVARRLEERFRAIAAQEGHEVDENALDFAVDFARLAVRSLSLTEPLPREREVLVRAIGARTGISEAAVQRLLDLALRPEHRASLGATELRAFTARFGGAAARDLQADSNTELDLAGFADRYDAAESLLLLDALFAVAGADGHIDLADVRQLKRAAQDLGVDEILVTALLQKHDPSHATGERNHPLLGGDSFTIGRSTTCDIVLSDPQVAPRHAQLVRIEDRWRAIDLGSGRPTLVKGSPITSAPLPLDAILRIGHYKLRVVRDAHSVDQLIIDGERAFSALSVRRLKRRIRGGDGQTVSLLDDVSFTVFSGEVIALVGPSGSGKTTLLNAISGIAPADSGDVLLDGLDFHRLLRLDRSLVGVVPQDDLVHAELTVEESLFYSGRLRFPPDVTDLEVRGEVDRVLHELDIAHIRKSRIGDALQRGISGGQRKRVNLGQELLTRSTRVLFLDEPTSGLDPRASQDIVRLVRQIADGGRIVFIVTHDLTPEVMAQVDHLLVLAPGGRLAWIGPPPEAARYFGVSTPDAIFNRFNDHPPEQWGRLYRESLNARKYVTAREHLIGLEGVGQAAGDEDLRRAGRSPLRQFATLTLRYLRVRLRDRMGVAVLGIQPVFLALVMFIVFPAPTAPFLFMLSLSCLWFGMSGSVRELISDRVIWRRESRVGVRLLAYMGSKTTVLSAVTALQCFFLAAFLHSALDMGEYGFSVWLLSSVCVMTGWLGMAMGLAVSAFFRSSEAAVGTLPLLLIPQITFSSIMVSVRDMGWAAKTMTWGTFQRYCFDALIKCGERIAVPTYKNGEWKAQPINGTLYKLGLKFSDAADDQGFDLDQLLAIIGGTTVFMIFAATMMVRAQSRKD